MKTITIPTRQRVFKDKHLKDYEKRWLWPLTSVIEHTRYEPEEPSMFWWLLGPIGLLVMLIAIFTNSKVKVTVYEVEKIDA